MIQRISEIEGEPVVGKYYLVPCARSVHGAWTPIIGPKHEDMDIIGFPATHYHYDLRFCSDRLADQILTYRTRRHQPSLEYALVSVLSSSNDIIEVRNMRRKCWREMPQFPIMYPHMPGVVRWFPKLEAAYKDTQLSSCLRCPHRGMPLKNLPVKDNKVICNGHGLQFDINTGRLVSRLRS